MKLSILVNLVFLIILTASCSKKDADSTRLDTYPKEVNITYRMSSLSGGISNVTSGS